MLRTLLFVEISFAKEWMPPFHLHCIYALLEYYLKNSHHLDLAEYC